MTESHLLIWSKIAHIDHSAQFFSTAVDATCVQFTCNNSSSLNVSLFELSPGQNSNQPSSALVNGWVLFSLYKQSFISILIITQRHDELQHLSGGTVFAVCVDLRCRPLTVKQLRVKCCSCVFTKLEINLFFQSTACHLNLLFENSRNDPNLLNKRRLLCHYLFGFLAFCSRRQCALFNEPSCTLLC